MFDAENRAFVSLAEGLTPEQWALPSLCPEWTVRDVVLHLTYHIHREGFQETFRSSKAMPRMVEQHHAESIDGLLAWLASPMSPKAATKVNLCELVIHQQDVRRPAGVARRYPEATLQLCLTECTTLLGNTFIVARTRRLGRGLRLVATDISWSKGAGPEVAGTGEALVMAIAGRAAAIRDLTGPGVSILAERLGTQLSSSSAAA
jgi:uncharacterized protein (TIGR03083 family)